MKTRCRDLMWDVTGSTMSTQLRSEVVDVISYTAVMNVCADAGQCTQTLRVHRSMLQGRYQILPQRTIFGFGCNMSKMLKYKTRKQSQFCCVWDVEGSRHQMVFTYVPHMFTWWQMFSSCRRTSANCGHLQCCHPLLRRTQMAWAAWAFAGNEAKPVMAIWLSAGYTWICRKVRYQKITWFTSLAWCVHILFIFFHEIFQTLVVSHNIFHICHGHPWTNSGTSHEIMVRRRGLQPNAAALNAAVCRCSAADQWRSALELMSSMWERGFQPDVTWNIGRF